MKKSLSEYGFAILAAIVVILLSLMLIPINETVEIRTEQTFDSYGEMLINEIKNFPRKLLNSSTNKWSDYKTIGGRIYADLGDKGSEYMFFDKDKKQISYVTLSDLENAVYYKIKNENMGDRFYVYATDSSGALLIDDDLELEWGANTTYVGCSKEEVSKGKSNTERALSVVETYQASITGNKTIWSWIKTLNDQNHGGVSDWYIPSRNEFKQLRNSGLTDVVDYSVWLSTEDDTTHAQKWSALSFVITSTTKSYSTGTHTVAIRSF